MSKAPYSLRRVAVTLATVPLLCCAAYCDTLPTIAPDRPGFTNGSDVITPGFNQIEAGFAVTQASSDSGGGRTTDFPEALLRRGVAKGLEARIAIPNYFTADGDGPKGFGDAAFGVKWRFYQNSSGSTKMALTPAITIPSRDQNYSSRQIDPSLVVGIQTTSGSRWGVSGNLNLSDPTVNRTRIAAAAPSTAVSYQLTPTLTTYGELYDNVPRTGRSVPITDGGFILVPNNNTQLDLEAGWGLGGSAPVRFIGGGVSVRY